MAYTELFETCWDSLSGIKQLKLIAKKQDGSPITFPLDVIIQSGKVVVSEDYMQKLFTVNGESYQYRDILPNHGGLEEEFIDERQGKLYRKNLYFSIPKVNLLTNNQIRDFLFASGEQYAITNICAFIIDNNNQNWIVGWDLPLELEEFDLKTDTRNGENSYVFRYVSESYNEIMPYTFD